jgi:tetratricopeptide (TPR) repeat protein
MDEFDEISSLLREGEHLKALGQLVGKDGRIRADYRADLNHAWYLAGNAAYDAGQINRALEFFKKSARTWPDDTQALMAIANCYSDLNKPRWTAHYLAKAIQIDPNNPDLNYNLANARFDLRQYTEAAKLYRKVIKVSKGETKKWAATNLERALERMRHSKPAKPVSRLIDP